MVRSRVFVLLAIALFLAGCLCAEASSASADRKTAVQDVNALKMLTEGVLVRAQIKFIDAESAKTTVEDFKRKAESAESAAKTAAADIKAKDRKEEAEAVAQEAEKELGELRTLYQNAKEKADLASSQMDGFLKRAKDLVKRAKIRIVPASGQASDYTNVIQSAAAVTADTQTLSREIDASTVLADADAALLTLQESAKKVQALKYQAESIAIVSRIESVLKTAETDIQNIQQKKDEINTIVQAMDKTFESAPDSLKGFFNSLSTNAGGFLRTATKRVIEAQKCNKDMLDRKAEVDQDLKTLKATDDESVAKTKFDTVKWHETSFADDLQKIKRALKAAENYVSSAKSVQQQMQNAISQHNSQSGTKLDNEKPNDQVPTEEVTNPTQNGKAKNPAITETVKQTVIKTDKPAITETEKTELEKSKDTMDKTSAQPVNTHLDSTEENKSVQLTHKEKQNPKDDKSELLNKDQLRNITKDITNNPLIGGEVPTRSAATDSAVTVFIPLLMTLVISAVLH